MYLNLNANRYSSIDRSFCEETRSIPKWNRDSMFLVTLIWAVSSSWFLPFGETKSESYPQGTWLQVKNEGIENEENPEIQNRSGREKILENTWLQWLPLLGRCNRNHAVKAQAIDKNNISSLAGINDRRIKNPREQAGHTIPISSQGLSCWTPGRRDGQYPSKLVQNHWMQQNCHRAIRARLSQSADRAGNWAGMDKQSYQSTRFQRGIWWWYLPLHQANTWIW